MPGLFLVIFFPGIHFFGFSGYFSLQFVPEEFELYDFVVELIGFLFEFFEVTVVGS